MRRVTQFLLLLMLLFSGCSRSQRTVATARADMPLRDSGDSRILDFRITLITEDTVAAILQGKVIGLCNQRPLPATVQLTTDTATYRTVAALDGTFAFAGLPAGEYTLTATCPPYRPLTKKSIEFGSGEVVVTSLGLKCYSERQ